MTVEAIKHSAFREFREGFTAVAPVGVAVVPIGLVYGALAAQKGLSPLEVSLSSLFVFAGSAQFVALDFWQQPIPWLALTLTALTINLRHIMMGASISRHLGAFPPVGRYAWMFLLTDEAWALAERRAATAELTVPYFAGLSTLLFVTWNVFSLAGAMLGSLVKNPAVYGFDFAFSALFIALVVGFWKGFRTAPVIAVSALAAIVSKPAFGGAWYVVIGGLAGMTMAVITAVIDRKLVDQKRAT